jgi:hypothetical protein
MLYFPGEHISSSESSSGSDNDEADHAMQELERKHQHPRRLHPEMWYNDPGEMNDGPLCRCSARTRRQGIRHGVYVSENYSPPCDLYSNNADKLYHYRYCSLICISNSRSNPFHSQDNNFSSDKFFDQNSNCDNAR